MIEIVWGIIAALKEELELLTGKMEEKRVTKLAGFDYYRGRIFGVELVAVQSSIGKVNAAICADILAREFEVTHMVNVGVAGAADPSLSVFDVVISDEMVYHDIDLEMYTRYFPFMSAFPADKGLITACTSVLEEMEGRPFRYKVGRIATGDIFVEDPALKQSIIQKVNPLCVEMEGAAVAQVAVSYGLPFIVIRSMSDNADGDGAVSFDAFLPQAAKYSAAILLKLIEKIK